MADTNTPVLDLHTVVHGRPIRIDEKLYQLRNSDSLSLTQSLKLQDLLPRLGKRLQKIRSLTDREEKQLSADLDAFCRLMVDAPGAVHAALSDAQRVAIVNAFIELRAGARTGAGAKRGAKTRRSTGAKSSRGSRASTPARASSTGTSASRSASSEPV